MTRVYRISETFCLPGVLMIGRSVWLPPTPPPLTWFDRGGNVHRHVRGALIHDRDPLFTAQFLSTLAQAGTKSVKLPPRSPNLNSYAERFVRSIKEGCLDRMILFGEEALRTAVREFVAHYHCERNHQGIGNVLIMPDPGIANRGGPV